MYDQAKAMCKALGQGKIITSKEIIVTLESLEVELSTARGEIERLREMYKNMVDEEYKDGEIKKQLKEENERLKCCGNCWKYPAANDERVCGHHGGAAGHDTEHNDECWEQRKGNMQLTEFKKRKTLQRYSFDREGSWAANDGKWYWRKDVLELENALEQAEAEKERLRRFEHCFAAQPGETTLECRHDNLCPYCQFQQLKKLVEELESQKCLKHCCERMTFAV